MDVEAIKTIALGFFGVLSTILTFWLGLIQIRDKRRADDAAKKVALTADGTIDRQNERENLATRQNWLFERMQGQIDTLQTQVTEWAKKNGDLVVENLQFRKDNLDLHDRVADLEKEKEALRSEMAAIERQHNTRIAEMEKQIADLQAIIGKMKGDMK